MVAGNGHGVYVGVFGVGGILDGDVENAVFDLTFADCVVRDGAADVREKISGGGHFRGAVEGAVKAIAVCDER